MDNNKIIIILLSVIIILLVTGIVLFNPFTAKTDTKITMSSNVLYQGDSLSISLTDANNTPLSNQKIDITIKDAKGEKQETVTTNEKGE